MAIEKTIELNLDASEAQKALNKFGGTLEDVYGEGVQPLNFAIGELEDRLYEMAAAGDTSSRQFMEMSAEVGRMKKVIIDTDLVLDGMSQNMAQKVGGAIGGLASGFELAQGAMATFGVESEAVEETLLKVQSAMAISQGFQGIREAVPSFKALGASAKMFGVNAVDSFKKMTTASKAFMATGLGLVITGIALAVANWDKLSRAISGNTEAQQLNNQVQKQALEGIAEELSAADKLTKQLADETLSREQKVKAVIDLQTQYPNLLSNIDAESATIGEVNKALELNTKLLKLNAQVKALQELRSEEYKKQLEAEVDAQTNSNKSLSSTVIALTNEKLARQVNTAQKKEAIRESQKQVKAYDELEKSLEKQIEALKKEGATVGEEENKKVKSYKSVAKAKTESVDKQIEEEKRLAEELAKIQEDARLAQIAEDEELSEVIRRARLDEQEKEIEDINTHYFNLIERAKQHGLDTAILEEEQNAKIKEINDKYEEERKAKEEEAKQKEKDANDEKVANERELRETQLQMASDALGAIGELVTSFAGESEEAQRRAFNINKAISIGQAIISTAQGVMAQLAVPQDALTGANFIKAGIVAATGVAQVATIARTQFNPSGGSGGGASSINAPQAPSQAPTFNVVGNTGVNQLAETLGSSPMQAYVVAGDVTTAQSLERNKIEQSTL